MLGLIEPIQLDTRYQYPKKSIESIFEQLDEETKQHSRRVECMVLKTAKKMRLSKNEQKELSVKARYHDIGKIMIPQELLQKDGVLTSNEYLHTKQHAICGAAILSIYYGEGFAKTIKYHHENEDGSGYYQKKGTDIPKHSQIIRVCDIYDSLVNKSAWSKEKAVKYIREQKGKLFSAKITEIFLQVVMEKL